MDKTKWTTANAMDTKNGNKIPPSYPNEMMVKVFSTVHYSRLFGQPVVAGTKVIDVGSGFGNNLVYFLDRGLEGYGVDVTDDMIGLAAQNMQRLGYEAKFSLGENQKIPYPDAYFEYLISVNTIHYEKDEAGIRAAFKEFRRVVKPGAKVFIMTAGPNHEIRAKVRRLGTLSYEVLDYGFRSNEQFAFFEDKNHLEKIAGEYFREVEVGLLREEFSTKTLEFMYCVGIA